MAVPVNAAQFPQVSEASIHGMDGNKASLVEPPPPVRHLDGSLDDFSCFRNAGGDGCHLHNGCESMVFEGSVRAPQDLVHKIA